MALQYKFVELSTVTDDRIEEIVNDWVGQGWSFEGIRFVTSEASRRPTMAFISFTREGAVRDDGRGEPPRRPPPLVKDEPPGEPAVITSDDDVE